VFLEPNSLGPPYNRLEIDKSTRSAFAAGTTTQRAIAVTGTFGYCDTTESAGTLAAAVSTTSATALTVSDSSLIGNGDTIKVDSERMLVTGRTMTTTSQTLLTPVGALVSDVTLAVTTGSSYAVGETLLLDSERMLVVDISGNNLTVKRAWDGTVLAAHTGSTIYAPRLLTVTRGLTGTTAATHLNAAAVSRQTVPVPIKDLTIAYALVRFLQETSGYARNIVGTGDRMTVATGGALPNLRKQVIEQYGRSPCGEHLMGVDIDASGPLFDGRAARIIEAACQDGQDGVADHAVNLIHDRLWTGPPPPDGLLREPDRH
jgi:hypothetical protein